MAIESSKATAESTLSAVLFRSRAAGGSPPSTTIVGSIQNAALVDAKLAVHVAEQPSDVQIREVRTLKLVQTLKVDGKVQSLRYENRKLFVETDRSLESFGDKDFERLRKTGKAGLGSSRTQALQVMFDGILVNGILRSNLDGPAKLLVNPSNFLRISGARSSLLNGSFLRQIPRVKTKDSAMASFGMAEHAEQMPLAIAVTANGSQVEFVSSVDPSSRTLPIQMTQMIIRGSRGQEIERRTIDRTPVFDRALAAPSPVDTIGNHVFLALGNRIYRQSVPDSDNANNRPSDDSQTGQLAPLHFVPEQQKLVMTKRVLRLNHQIQGGEAPFEFVLQRAIPGVSVDRTSGKVTLNQSQIRHDALACIRKHMQLPQRPGNGTSMIAELSKALKKEALNFADDFRELNDQKARGFPVAIPIHLKVLDHQGATAEIQYFVIADLPIADLSKQWVLDASKR